MEPLCRGQKLLSECVCVRLTAVLQDWDSSALTQPASESWVLHRSGCSAPGAEAFQQLVTELSARCLHVVSTVHDAVALATLTHPCQCLMLTNDGNSLCYVFKISKNG